MDLQTAIDRFRDVETKETAAIVLQDKDLQRLLAAWPQVQWTAVEPPPWTWSGPVDWAELWKGVRIDEAGLLDMTGLQTGRARVALRRAISLRLIYPDGTVHKVGRLVLQKLLKDALTGGKA